MITSIGSAGASELVATMCLASPQAVADRLGLSLDELAAEIRSGGIRLRLDRRAGYVRIFRVHRRPE